MQERLVIVNAVQLQALVHRIVVPMDCVAGRVISLKQANAMEHLGTDAVIIHAHFDPKTVYHTVSKQLRLENV